MSIQLLEEHIQNGDTAALGQLLNGDKSLAKSMTSYKVSAILLACYFKKADIINLLLNYIDDLTLFEAAAIGKFDDVANLIYKEPGKVNDFSDDGFTALGLACFFGQPQIAQYLVLKGADVNQASRNGFNVAPIHSAVAANQVDITRMLLDNGAKVNVLQQMGVTPLHSAAQNGNLEILIMLLEHGAEVNTRMEGGKTPADLAREKGLDEIAEILEA